MGMVNGGMDAAKPIANKFAETAHQGMEHAIASAPDQMLSSELAAYRRGPEAYKRWQRVQQMSPVSKILTGAGTEAIDLAKGFNEAAYNVGGTVADIWHQEHPGLVSQKAVDTLDEKAQEMRDQYGIDNDINKEFRESSGIFGNIGASLPYVVSGELLGKPFAKVGGKIVSGIAEGPETLIQAGKQASESVIDKLARSSSTPVKNVAGRIKKVITDPWKESAIASRARPVVTNPYMIGRGGELVGNMGLGAVEGSLDPNSTAKSGAINSVIGTVTGQAIKPAVTIAPNFRSNNPVEQSALKWYKGQGGRLLPGLETGSKRLQNFERTLSSDTTYADPLHRIMAANDIVNNRIAANAMGMPATSKQSFTPKHLMEHKNALGEEYNKLEEGTVANFTPQDKTNLVGHFNRLNQDKTKAGKSISGDVADYLRQIDQLTPNRNMTTGRIRQMNMAGSDFKDLRSRLQSDITGSFQQGDHQRANALKPILKTVDNAVERGVEKKGGTAGVAQWKDLNERYAITQLVMDHGLSPTGQFDPSKMYQHLANNDIRRIVLGEGGRVKALHKLAQVEHMSKHQSGPDISGLTQNNMFNRVTNSPIEKMLMTPYAGWPGFSPISNAALKLYASERWSPAKFGLLHMSGKGFGNPVTYTRAYEQANQPHLKIGNAIIDAAKYIPDKVEGIYDWAKNKINEK
jgi:hypothetical protein